MSKESDFCQALVARPDPAASQRQATSIIQGGLDWYCVHGVCVDGQIPLQAMRVVGIWWPEGSEPVLYAVSRDRRLLESRVAKPQLARIAEHQRNYLYEEFGLIEGIWLEEWVAELVFLGVNPGMHFNDPPAALRIELAWHPQSLVGRHHAGPASEAALRTLWHNLVAELDPKVLRDLTALGLPATVGLYNLRCAARAGVASREAAE